MPSNNNNIIEFEVPEELKEYGFTRTAKVGPFVKALYKGQSISANFDVAKLKPSTKELREEAGKLVTSNGIDASDIIEKFVSFVLSEYTNRYEKDLMEGKTTTVGNGRSQQQGEGTQQRPQTKESVTTMKYTSIIKKQQQDASSPVLPQPQLWETVRIAGRYYLISYVLKFRLWKRFLILLLLIGLVTYMFCFAIFRFISIFSCIPPSPLR